MEGHSFHYSFHFKQEQEQLIAAIERAGMSRVSNGLPPSHAFTESDADSSLEIALAATLELVWCYHVSPFGKLSNW